MKLGFFQFSPVFGDIKKNVDTVFGAVREQRADLLVLPELFSTGYQFVSKEEAEALSEEIPEGPTTKKLIGLSRDLSSYVVAGISERDGDLLFNSAVLTGPEGFLGKYRKTHLFYEEKLWFSPGDSGFRVWKTPFCTVGIMICFDWFFPESARTLALRGAEIIAHPANLVLPHCPDAMVTRSLENRVFSITANRTGFEERGGKNPLGFIGSSEIVSPAGRVLYRASSGAQELGIVEVDPTEALDKRLNDYNDLFADRRQEHYFEPKP